MAGWENVQRQDLRGPMLDLIIRNARLPDEAGGRLVDIGISQRRIAAIESRIDADAMAHDAEGCLCCAGLVETHIHLDKSRILDRCSPEPSRSQPDHMRRVQAVKNTFTVEDIYDRAKETLEACCYRPCDQARGITPFASG
jgi:cytosine/creatinine deaminase